MTPEKYCQTKAAPPGTTFYFALANEEHRQSILAVQAFYQEIHDIPYHCHEPELALRKLSWWREELRQLGTGHALSHPVLQALQQYVHPLDIEELSHLVDAEAQNLMVAPFLNFEELTLHILHTAGRREKIAAASIGEFAADNICLAALIIELVRAMQQLHRDVSHGFVFFAADEMQQYGVDVNMLRFTKTSLEVKSLLSAQATKVREAYKKLLKQATLTESSLLVNLFVRCRMAVSLLDKIEKQDFAVLESLICLSPLHYWWINFSERRRVQSLKLT